MINNIFFLLTTLNLCLFALNGESDVMESKQLFSCLSEQGSLLKDRGVQNNETLTSCIFHQIYEARRPNLLKVNEKPLIPKIIHQIWIGPNPIPEKVKWMMQTWKTFHPNWEYRLWTNRELEEFGLVNQKAFDESTNWGAKSDVWRCEILDRLGGVYVDVDFECVKPLDELHHLYDFYCCILDQGEVANGLIAACPGHVVMKSCIDQWGKIPFFSTKDPELIISLTGPVFFTNEIIESFINHPLLMERAIVLPSHYFFAFPRDLRFKFWNKEIAQAEAKKYITQESYAIHYWATTWQTQQE